MRQRQIPLANNTKYYVIDWQTNEVLAVYETLNSAKKDCRDRGYLDNKFVGKMPIAYVAADFVDDYNVRLGHTDTPKVVRCCVYSPRYK